MAHRRTDLLVLGHKSRNCILAALSPHWRPKWDGQTPDRCFMPPFSYGDSQRHKLRDAITVQCSLCNQLYVPPGKFFLGSGGSMVWLQAGWWIGGYNSTNGVRRRILKSYRTSWIRNAGMPCYWLDDHGCTPCRHDGEVNELWVTKTPPWRWLRSLAFVTIAIGYGSMVQTVTCFNACSRSLSTNTLVSKVCMLLTEGKTAHSILWKVRQQSRHQA